VSGSLVAFIDESHRPVRDRKTGKADLSRWFYVIGVVVVFSDDIEACRQQLADIETKLGYELHYHDLKSPTRRTNAVDAIASLPSWDGFIIEDPKPIPQGGGYEQTARERLLYRGFPLLAGLGVTRVVLETRVRATTRQATLDERDRAVVVKLRQQGRLGDSFITRHTTKAESMLKLADMLASCRTDFLCARSEEIYPRIGHRVTIHKTSP